MLFSLLSASCSKLTAWIQSCSGQDRMTTLHFKTHVTPRSKSSNCIWSTQLLCLFLGLIWSQGRPIVARWILKSCLCWPVLGHLYTRWVPYLYTLGRRGNILYLEEKVLMVQNTVPKRYNWCSLFSCSFWGHVKSPLGTCLAVRLLRS